MSKRRRFGCLGGHSPPVKTCSCWHCREAFPDNDPQEEQEKIQMEDALNESSRSVLEVSKTPVMSRWKSNSSGNVFTIQGNAVVESGSLAGQVLVLYGNRRHNVTHARELNDFLRHYEQIDEGKPPHRRRSAKF